MSQENTHLIRDLRRIEKVFQIADKDLSTMYHYLDTPQRVEEEYGSFRLFSDNTHLLETANRVQQECYSFRNFGNKYLCFHDNKYPSLKGPDVISTLERIAAERDSFYKVLEGYHTLDTLQRIGEHWGSFHVFTEEYLLKSSHLLQILRGMPYIL